MSYPKELSREDMHDLALTRETAKIYNKEIPMPLEGRINLFRNLLPSRRQKYFDKILYDVRKAAAMHPYNYLPIFKTNNMRSIEELKKEIDELHQVRLGISTEIELMNSKNRNAQAKRDRITAKIDGLEWVLNNPDEQ